MDRAGGTVIVGSLPLLAISFGSVAEVRLFKRTVRVGLRWGKGGNEVGL